MSQPWGAASANREESSAVWMPRRRWTGAVAAPQSCDVVARHREPGCLAIERDRVLPDRLQQAAVHRGAQSDDGRAAHHLRRGIVHALQEGAVQSPRLALRRCDPASQHHVSSDAQFPKRRHRVRGDEQREAQLPHRCGALEVPDVPARLPQGDGGRQTTDAGADDERPRARHVRRRYAARSSSVNSLGSTSL